LAWHAGASPDARAVLERVAASPKNANGVPANPCAVVDQGGVGPMQAPFSECAGSTPYGDFVRFTTLSRPFRGLGYTDLGAATFPDECSRHLTGKWWMFVVDSNGMGNCPTGYRFAGAP
jgi:hypothetical protein